MEKRDIKGTSRSQNAIFDVPFEDAVELAKIANGIILDKVSFEISIGEFNVIIFPNCQDEKWDDIKSIIKTSPFATAINFKSEGIYND